MVSHSKLSFRVPKIEAINESLFFALSQYWLIENKKTTVAVMWKFYWLIQILATMYMNHRTDFADTNNTFIIRKYLQPNIRSFQL